uniref:S-protein homolog 2-like n=1 Tax=Erigeron canadensis TaxID=72917 RepID=UPI001CB975D0|nr:S-protein homolog 2-like [Erigeron canadensis]
MALIIYYIFLIVLSTFHVYFVTSIGPDVNNLLKPSNLIPDVVNSFRPITSFEPYTVQVIDSRVDQLVVHVFSADDDLGNKTLGINDAFHWNFRMNSPETTSYKGEFFWMNPDGTPLKEVDFIVFDKNVAVECGQNIFKTNRCFWNVTDAGFYFAKDDPSNWKLKYSWN